MITFFLELVSGKKKTMNEPGVYEWLRGGEGAHEVLFIDECGDAAPHYLLQQQARIKTTSHFFKTGHARTCTQTRTEMLIPWL